PDGVDPARVIFVARSFIEPPERPDDPPLHYDPDPSGKQLHKRPATKLATSKPPRCGALASPKPSARRAIGRSHWKASRPLVTPVAAPARCERLGLTTRYR